MKQNISMDYQSQQTWTNPLSNCPRLFLAPMEGVGDVYFRQAISTIGGFDEATTEFLRVPRNAQVFSLAKKYRADEIAPIPLAAQIMGNDAELLAAMAAALSQRHAPRIDFNCGCPSNIVVGRGSGSSLLKTPDLLYKIAKNITNNTNTPLSIKMRTGFDNTSLFKENLMAAQEGGASFIILHPRTRQDGFKAPINMQLLAEAKSLLSIPLVGNGDILILSDALEMLKQTKCDGLMIGRGAVANPWIFQEIQAYFRNENCPNNWNDTKNYINTYCQNISSHLPVHLQTNKFKQMIHYLFSTTPILKFHKLTLLRKKVSLNSLKDEALSLLSQEFYSQTKNR